MVFQWSLSDSKSPQISRTLLSILIPLFPSPPVSLPILWWLLRMHRLQLVLPSLLFMAFWHQQTKMICYWSSSDSKSPHVSRTLLSILADLNNLDCLFVLWFPTLPASKCTDYNLYKWSSCSTFFFFLVVSHDSSICLSFIFLLFSLHKPPGR